MRKVITICVLGIFIHCNLFAQKSTDPSDMNAVLFSSAWGLSELYGSPASKPGMKTAYLILQRGGNGLNRITGFTGCNYIGGRINMPGQSGIVFHPELITHDNCAGGSVESVLLEALLQADKWSEKSGQLLLHHKGKVIARWTPVSTYNPALTGSWQLAYVSTLQVPFLEIFPDPVCPEITFSEKNKTIRGFSGCHDFTATFLMQDHSIFFNETTPCDTTCTINKENVYLTTMSQVNGYYFKDDATLVLVNNGEPVMAFRRKKSAGDAVTAGIR